MDMDKRPVPFFAARLIIGFLQNKLSKSEQDLLDAWICESDENMTLFEELTAGYDEAVFDPSRLIIETEEVTEIWIIAGLITKYLLGHIDEIEEKHLMEWVAASERNQMLFIKMQQADFLGELLLWLRPQLRGRVNLN